MSPGCSVRTTEGDGSQILVEQIRASFVKDLVAGQANCPLILGDQLRIK